MTKLPSPASLLGVNHISLTVASLERSLNFYQQLLGARLYVTWNRGAYLTIGSLWLCLNLGKPTPSGDYSHLALDIRVEHFETFAERLRSAGIHEWQQNTSEGSSIYLSDPDGHKLEIHAGSLSSRLRQLESSSYQGLKWAEPLPY